MQAAWDDSVVPECHLAWKAPWNCDSPFTNEAAITFALIEHDVVIHLGSTNQSHDWLFVIFPYHMIERSHKATGDKVKLCDSGCLRYLFKVGDDWFYLLMRTLKPNPLIVPNSMTKEFFLFEEFIRTYPTTLSGRFFHWLRN